MKSLPEFFKSVEEMAWSLSDRVPVLRGIMQRQYRLKSFVCVSTLVVSFLCFNLAFLMAFSLYQNLFERRAHEVAQSVSQQVLGSMFRLMEKGWSEREVEEYFGSLNRAQGGMTYQVRLYRNETPGRPYRERERAGMDAEVKKVLATGVPLSMKSGYRIADIYPIKAREGCMSCHVHARTGDVLGAVKILQDMGPAVDETKRKLTLFALLLFPVPFLLAGLIATFLNARIHRSTELFHAKIKDVSSVRDLTSLEMEEVRLGFVEFNDILRDIDHFAKRIRDVAVDKRILEFELEVLEKFIITSEVVRDWKEHVMHLLSEVNKVIAAYTLFSLFQVDEEVYELEIFWINAPTETTRERVERIISRKVVAEHARLRGIASLKVNHTIADSSNALSELKERDIELQTKSLILQNPQIGGVVGIGVQSVQTRDPIRSLVIDGILTTLLNVVGSVKAIYKYTKDLEFYATRDPLTNLYNQRVFWELIGYEVGRAERHSYKFSLLVIDLDNFKNINDSYGHTFGDRFLAETAAAIQAALRHGDILARYGGDEFVVILPYADEEQAFLVANRIKDGTGCLTLTVYNGTKVKSTVSIGLAVFPDHATNAKDLFLFADNMMYKAKAEGKNTVIVPTEEDLVEVFRQTGEKTMIVMDAIENKTVLPYFQPIIDAETGRVVCHEVLGRIRTEKGIMSAGEFIEVAERLGVVNRLDHVLMEKVFEKVQVEGYTGYLFINLSPKSLILKEFIPTVLKHANKYGMDKSKIVFEITERDTVKNISLLEKFVHDLKFEGFKFAIDDFGSGFSSFHYIKRFPIDFVKIEGDFIRNMVADSRDRALVKNMALLAREFNIKTVAEHVEDERILSAVREVGIDYGQGYHIGRPSPELLCTEGSPAFP